MKPLQPESPCPTSLGLTSHQCADSPTLHLQASVQHPGPWGIHPIAEKLGQAIPMMARIRS